MTLAQEKQRLREEICHAAHQVAQAGWVAANDGNLSARCPDGHVLITPSGLYKGDVTPELLLELTLEGECPDASFTPASRDVYSPDCLVDAGQGQTSVTICLTAEGDSLMEGRSLSLGTLYPGGSCTLPSRIAHKSILDCSSVHVFSRIAAVFSSTLDFSSITALKNCSVCSAKGLLRSSPVIFATSAMTI